ncbi:2-phospho-L-lactate guanylyltransferase [Microbacterium sp. JZ31]|uniref:2-phospho-L-lactate guanylyltransferase n=1 Tax=Microbacterium sp. JZ31 TaxID=1906274 RepID=UPI0019339C4A|nr:2-phospho-L-lactate guanylyltransferase [Microbacterium sp. JZ31]
MTGSWTVVIPVKGSTGKSRLAHPDRAGLASAIALDTIDAVCRAEHVGAVVVVTSDGELALQAVSDPGGTVRPTVRVVPDPGDGLNPAVAAGLAAADPTRPRAALLGDLPALDPADLDAVLERAAAHERAFVADVEGTGTTLLTGRPGAALAPAFGADSAARHAAAGFTSLPVPEASTVRRDVDTAAQLREAAHLGLGPRTSALL